MALTDKKYANEHPKFNMFDKYKADKDSLVGARADISGKDIDASKMRGFSSVDLDTARMISNNLERKALQITLEEYNDETGWTGGNHKI